MDPGGYLFYLMTHSELSPEMGLAGRRFVGEHYDIRKLNRRLAEIYETLLAGQPNQPDMSTSREQEQGGDGEG